MSFGVDNNLERTGIMMRPNADVVRKAQLKLTDTAHLIVTLARRNMPNLFEELSSRWMPEHLSARSGAIRRCAPAMARLDGYEPAVRSVDSDYRCPGNFFP